MADMTERLYRNRGNRELSREWKIPFQVGDQATSSKTVSEGEIYLFAGISGDMNPVHVNEQYMSRTDMKRRIAHGLYVFSMASATEYIILSHHPNAKKMDESGLTYLSYGYDHVRFLKPVYIGDTLTSTYEVTAIENDAMRLIAQLSVVNQEDELVFVARHILKFFPKEK